MNNGYKIALGRYSEESQQLVAFFYCWAVLSPSLAIRPSRLCAQNEISIPEEIEWTWEVRPQVADSKLPNVLLLGDSITRNYFPQVTKDLGGIANIYLLASSSSVGDPRLYTAGATRRQFKSSFPLFLQAIRALPGPGKLIWATITPVKPEAFNGASNSRIETRNAIARTFIEAGRIPIDDEYALMTQHPDLYEDAFHFNKAGSAMMGVQAATSMRRALENSGHERPSH